MKVPILWMHCPGQFLSLCEIQPNPQFRIISKIYVDNIGVRNGKWDLTPPGQFQELVGFISRNRLPREFRILLLQLQQELLMGGAGAHTKQLTGQIFNFFWLGSVTPTNHLPVYFQISGSKIQVLFVVVGRGEACGNKVSIPAKQFGNHLLVGIKDHELQFHTQILCEGLGQIILKPHGPMGAFIIASGVVTGDHF